MGGRLGGRIIRGVREGAAIHGITRFSELRALRVLSLPLLRLEHHPHLAVREKTMDPGSRTYNE